MIRNENGRLAGFIVIPTLETDVGGLAKRAQKAVDAAGIAMPPGYRLEWSGQYEHIERVFWRMVWVLPITAVVILLILYINTKSAVKTAIVFSAVFFSAVGAIWLLYILGYNLSVAVYVGLIALMGLDAETGVFMLLFLDMSYAERAREGKMKTFEDLTEAVIHGAVKRIRPKLMTVACAFIGLLPIMWSTGTGADVMKRVAAPLMGGLVTSFIMELLVYPAIYTVWKWRFEMKRGTVDVSNLPLPEFKEGRQP
jgi:copper/silver efflux system protein